MIRLLSPVPTPAPEALKLDGERRHYLVHVLRLAVGDGLEIFDGTGRAFDATVTQLDDVAVHVSLGPERRARRARSITVIQGLPKGDKLELVLQKGCELGASAFLPVATDRSIVKLEPKRALERAGRWAKIVEEAARQCRRDDVPPVGVAQPLRDAVAGLAPGTRVFVLDEEEQALPLGAAFRACEPTQPVAIVIGPEGGLSREEVVALRASGAHPVTLGARILRTETAALAALAVMRHLDGELG